MDSQLPADSHSLRDAEVDSDMNGEEANGRNYGLDDASLYNSAFRSPAPYQDDGIGQVADAEDNPGRGAFKVKGEVEDGDIATDAGKSSPSAVNHPRDRGYSSASASSYHSAAETLPLSDSTKAICYFPRLPPELVDAILSHLSPYDLATVSATCRSLRQHALSDVHWQRLVQDNVPGLGLTNPGPCSSYYELYAAHDRLWFLPKYKIWFCDRDLMGKMIIVRYDPRRGCIEGFQLLASRGTRETQPWEAHHRVLIYGFAPVVKLHLDKPVLQFRVQKSEAQQRFVNRPGANRFADEMPMELDDRLNAVFSNFLFAKALDPDVAEAKLESGYPYGRVWPPLVIPAFQHVSGVNSILDPPELDQEDHPQTRSEVTDQAFRIRQWVEMAGGAPGRHRIAALLHTGLPGIHIGEEIITYSTLDPVLYTPTALKPWRGIWVGDYSTHGCEFLLINQPDDLPATDEDLDLVRGEAETDEQWEKRRADGHLYRGRLEAIKLTGDPNVPRGEYTFVADDLGPGGFISNAVHPPFEGARVVRSKGHVASTGFVDDTYIDCELILISHDRLAQYWVTLRHVSYFQRVDVDSFLKP